MPKKIAAFGEVMMRLQVPGFDSLAQSDTLRYTFSGTGVNVISALSRFGHESYLVTTLPDNPVGDAAVAFLRKLGIATTYVSRGGKYIGMYFLENGFGVRPSRVTYADRQGSSFNRVAAGPYDFSEIAGLADYVHFCGITLAMNDGVREQMKRFAAEAKRAGAAVAFDCNYRPALWGEEGYAAAKPHYEEMLALADIVLMNERDAMLTLGMGTSERDRMGQLKELIPQVARRYGIGTIAGTHRGVNGDNSHSLTGFMYREGEFVFSDTLTFQVHDRIGAGDAYASGILHGAAKGLPPRETVEFAAAAAMLAHTVAGDTPIATEAEVLRAMSGASRDIER